MRIEEPNGYTIRDAHARATPAQKRRDAYYGNSVVSQIDKTQAQVHEKHERSWVQMMLTMANVDVHEMTQTGHKHK